jgi:hypothetical protein
MVIGPYILSKHILSKVLLIVLLRTPGSDSAIRTTTLAAFEDQYLKIIILTVVLPLNDAVRC